MAAFTTRGPPTAEDRLFDIMWMFYGWEKDYAREQMEEFVQEYIYGKTKSPKDSKKDERNLWFNFKWDGYDDSK